MNTVKNIIPIRGNQQMNNQLPEPPVTADCDLRTFRYMPFDVARFRDSRFSAVIDPAAGFFAIQLWAAAWHQVPAGSLPNEDAMLRMLSGCGRDQRLWDSVKDGALYGFVPHADGRLYHPAITEFVIEAYGKLLKNTENGKKGGRPPKPSANPTLTDGKPNDNPTLTDGKPNANPTLTQHEPSEVKGSEVKGSEDKHTVQKTTSNPPSAEEPQPLASDVCIPENDKKSSIAKKPSRKASMPSNFAISTNVREWANKSGYGLLEARLEHFRNWATAKGATYADWDAAFRNAIAGDWANLNGRKQPVNGHAATDNNPPQPRYLN